MRTKKELNALKEEVDTVNKKRHALTNDELEQVSGGLRDECVYEENGIFAYLYCENCGMRFSIDDFQEAIEHEIDCRSGRINKNN